MRRIGGEEQQESRRGWFSDGVRFYALCRLGVCLGVFWFMWGAWGFWWGVLLGLIWEIWLGVMLGIRLAEWLTG